MLDRGVILACVAYRGGSQRRLGRAARLRRSVRFAEFQWDGFVAPAIHIGDVRFFLVVHSHQRRCETRDFRLFGDDQRDRLAVEPNPPPMKGDITRTSSGFMSNAAQR